MAVQRQKNKANVCLQMSCARCKLAYISDNALFFREQLLNNAFSPSPPSPLPSPLQRERGRETRIIRKKKEVERETVKPAESKRASYPIRIRMHANAQTPGPLRAVLLNYQGPFDPVYHWITHMVQCAFKDSMAHDLCMLPYFSQFATLFIDARTK